MRLLDFFTKRKSDNNPEHDINPVYDTAKSCLVNLAKAQCEEALLLNNVLQFTKDTNVNSSIEKGIAIFQEVRYRYINDEIQKTGIQNILDVGCGYSPRGILCSKLGYNYIGVDLPAAIKEVEPAINQCIEKDNNESIKYVALDITDHQSLMNTVSAFDGPVCIIIEGVFMYLPIFELNEFLKGIRKILSIHGGCLITPDFCMNRLLKLSISATSNSLFGRIFQFGATKIVKEYYVQSANEMDPSNWYAVDNDKKPYEYFTSRGFNVERIPIYNPDIKLCALKEINDKRAKKLLDGYMHTYAWKTTLQ